MTTLSLYSPFVSENSSGQTLKSVLLQLWSAFIEARKNRAMMMVSFYSAK